jgi:hypothetical protein
MSIPLSQRACNLPILIPTLITQATFACKKQQNTQRDAPADPAPMEKYLKYYRRTV